MNAWAAESGIAGKALYDRQRTAKLLADFLGHDDAARVTAEDVVRWKEARLAAGRSAKTVANDIGELRPIWAWGRANRKLKFAENPFAGLAPKTKKRAGARVRGPYIQQDGGGVWFLHIHAEGAGRTLKTVQSERNVPLHPALIDEGFLRHVQSLPSGSPLFPDLKPDKFGMLKGTATKKHGHWVRHTVGITDKTKDPAHAWRHRFEDQARRASVPQNVTDGLMGHLNAANEAEGYGRGFRFMPDTTAPWVAKMASPLPAPIDAAAT